MAEVRNTGQAVRRGLGGRCPRCGEGPLFAGYLDVSQACGNCGEPLASYRAADGPAFFTMTIVGLLLVPMLGIGFVAFRPEPVVLLAWVTVIAGLLTLVLLRFVKGAIVGYLWAQDERDPGA
jgi:uncharacterized protein (DUF983 family)